VSQRTFRLITIAGAALCILSFAGGIVRVVSINRETAGIVQQAEEWERKTGGVYQEIEEAGSHQYIERVAREELGLVKPGETLYIVAQPDSSGYQPVAPRPGHTPEIGD
jgi:cell division protein FtsB